MAKKQPTQDDYDELLDVRKPTVQPPAQVDQVPTSSPPTPQKRGRGRPRNRDLAPEDVDSVGVGITKMEGDKLRSIAAELGINRHQLLTKLVRDFLKKWDSGWRPATEQRTVLKDDSLL